MEANNEVKQNLLVMGFDAKQVDAAYEKAPIKTVEGIINYIEANPNIGADDQITGIEGQDQAQAQPEKNPEAQPEGQPITDHINTQFRDQIIGMGFSRHPAEKSLFMTGNKNVQSALEWLEQNKDEPDFNEQLFIVGQAGSTSKLTPEEAKQKAKELQKQLRIKRAEKDKELERQREKDRLRVGKELAEARRKQEEQSVKNEIYRVQKEKEETQKAKQAVLEKIRRDKEERTGKKIKPKRKTPKEAFSDIFYKMKKIYPVKSISEQQMKTCIKTVGIYVSKYSFDYRKCFKRPERG